MSDRTAERLRSLLHPATAAVLTMELQEGVVGDEAVLPALTDAVRQAGTLQAAGRLCAAARAAGVRVVHATMEARPDGVGITPNCKVFALADRQRQRDGYAVLDRGRPGARVCAALDPQPSDVVVARMHGITPFTGTELDAVLRALGTRTVVVAGVSLNLGVIGTVLSAVDLGYHAVVACDAVIGVPADYGEAMLRHSFPMIASVATVDDVIACWPAH